MVASVALVVGLMPLLAIAEPADKHQLTIIAVDQTYVYNGEIQGPGDAVYEDPAEIAEKIKVVGLQGDDAITSIVLDGQGRGIGDYDLVPSNATIGEHTDDYDITYVPGTLHIVAPQATVTITGNKDSVPYDGKEHSVKGYTVKIESNDGGYTADDFTGPAQADAVAKGTDAGTYPMGLTDAEFVNTNERYAVTFKVTDGELEITAPPKGEYEVASGAGGTWTKGSSDTLTFSFKRAEDNETTFKHFTGIEVDGKAIPEKDASGQANWTAKSGSVIIDLQPSLLEALDEGDHALNALFDDGEATATFKVAAKAAPAAKESASKDALPNTGDTTLPLTVAAAIAATSAAALLAVRRRKA